MNFKWTSLYKKTQIILIIHVFSFNYVFLFFNLSDVFSLNMIYKIETIGTPKIIPTTPNNLPPKVIAINVSIDNMLDNKILNLEIK